MMTSAMEIDEPVKSEDLMDGNLVPEINDSDKSEHEEHKKENVFEATLPGNRIVNLGYVLSWAIYLQHEHAKDCSGVLFPNSETSRGIGLVSIIEFKCTVCREKIYKSTEDMRKIDQSVINTGVVWGTLATGGTYGHLEEFSSCVDVPMRRYKFESLENQLEEVGIYYVLLTQLTEIISCISDLETSIN